MCKALLEHWERGTAARVHAEARGACAAVRTRPALNLESCSSTCCENINPFTPPNHRQAVYHFFSHLKHRKAFKVFLS